MPEFTYRAKTIRGASVQGTITAGGRREALATLASKSLFPLSVQDIASHSRWIQLPTLGRRISAELLSDNLAQLADLLSNGVPLLKSLRVLATQAKNPTLAQILTKVCNDVADGAALEEAMAQHPRVFGDLVVNMVRAGSAGAFLEEALQRTADFLTRQEELKRKVKGAMAYPVFLAVTGFIVTTVLIVFFVPKFAGLFARLEAEGGLPWMTSALLWLSDTFKIYGLIILAVGIAAVLGLKWLINTDQGQRVCDNFRLHVPLMGPVARGYAVARFCRVLGTLLGNGVPLLKSLDISGQATTNVVFAEAIQASAATVSSGETLAGPLEASGLFPPSIMAMIHVAEEANNLDHVLLQIADRIERRNEQQLEILVRLLEPIMLLVMGAIMLFVILALLLPIFDMGSTIG